MSMAAFVAFNLVLFSAISALRIASASSFCPLQSINFINALQSQCPLSVPTTAPAEVNGEFLERVLSSNEMHTYTALLFYSTRCPFSISARSTFDILSSMFPQIMHLAVEESSAILFSRYGVHSLPALFIANRTTRMRYYGSKDLSSLVHFYKKTAGLQPVEYSSGYQTSRLESEKTTCMPSLREILRRDLYLVFSLLFLCLKAFSHSFLRTFYHLKAIWVSYGWHPNLGFFRETSQLLERILHVVNVKRAWSKQGLCKTSNFQNRAKNARVWASSLASVSLGEALSTRSTPLDL